MEENVRDSQLNSFLQKHKQMQERSAFKSYHLLQEKSKDSNNFSTSYNSNDGQSFISQGTVPTTMTNKVYVNPNYERKNPSIHVNPHVQVKVPIYVNPNIIQKITSTKSQEQIIRNIVRDSKPTISSSISNTHAVHVNPKMISKLISSVPEETYTAQQDPTNLIETSSTFHNHTDSYAPVQDKSVTFSTKKKSEMYNTQKAYSENYTTQPKVKEKIANTYKRSSNSGLVTVSKRKLIRIIKSPKAAATSSCTLKSVTARKRLSSSGSKKVNSPLKIMRNPQLSKVNNTRPSSSSNVGKTTWYSKVNKTTLKSSPKKVAVPSKRISNNSMGLISIGGIMYKKSRNQLVQTSPGISSVKRKINLTLHKSNQYYITKNGRKLLKVDLTKNGNTSPIKLNISNTSSNSSTRSSKTNLSNKVKQRSLQILRNKMGKNNQPCLIFQKFGHCARYLKGSCPKVHDKKQVALCKNFLQGNCLLDNCPLSHDVGPEKMPTCKYFLEGCCTRDGCPYLHVKVSSKNPICVEFLRGYCLQGNECQKRHVDACPEFDKSGKCSKGKFCPYPHKSQLTGTRRFKVTRHKSNKVVTKESEKTPTESEDVVPRKRYYEDTNENLDEKRARLLNQVEIIKDVHANQSNAPAEEKDIESSELVHTAKPVNSEENLEIVSIKPKRPPMGPLPAYIPID